MALTEAVGPIEPTAARNADLLQVPDFVAGFIYELTGDLQLEYLETCMVSSDTLLPYIMGTLTDLKQLKI